MPETKYGGAVRSKAVVDLNPMARTMVGKKLLKEHALGCS
jgi:hypothetical protein